MAIVEDDVPIGFHGGLEVEAGPQGSFVFFSSAFSVRFP